MYLNSIRLIIALSALFLSYLFTLIENAYLTLNPLKLEKLKEIKIKNYEYIEKNCQDKNRIFATTLIADYFSNIVCSVFITAYFDEILEKYGLYIGLFISIISIIIFGELVPQALGKKNFEKIVNRSAKFLYYFGGIISPLVIIIRLISSFLINIRGGLKDYREPLITEDDLKHAFTLGHKEGLIDKSEMNFIENVMDFRDTVAKDIMTPRTDISAIDIDTNYKDIVELIGEEGFSRIPVYENDLDNILGILHVKDLFTQIKYPEKLDLKTILRPPFFTYEYKPIPKLFNEMRGKKVSVAIVLDEYGGTEGMITTEDLIEKIVGAISDEYDIDEEDEIIKLNNTEYLIEGSTNLSDINHTLNLNLQSEEFDTIAGYIIENIDRFPKIGETIVINNIKYYIKETSKNRIDKIIMKI